jgi:hypothetical protein
MLDVCRFGDVLMLGVVGPANVLGVSCTAKSRVPKPDRRGGCRE